MPAFPARFDIRTLSEKFNLMDSMDPKGSALAKEVGAFADEIVFNALGSYGM